MEEYTKNEYLAICNDIMREARTLEQEPVEPDYALESRLAKLRELLDVVKLSSRDKPKIVSLKSVDSFTKFWSKTGNRRYRKARTR